jgi:hypothetical protein
MQDLAKAIAIFIKRSKVCPQVKKEREDHLRKEIAPNLWKSQPFSW